MRGACRQPPLPPARPGRNGRPDGPLPTHRRYPREAFRVSGHGNLQVSNIMPPQRRQGAGQGIGLWVVVVSPHVKQIHAVLHKQSSGPTISSGRPRRLINSHSFMSHDVGLPGRQLQQPPGGSSSCRIQGRTERSRIEGIGHDARSLTRLDRSPRCGRLRTVCFFAGVPSPGPPLTHGTGSRTSLARPTWLSTTRASLWRGSVQAGPVRPSAMKRAERWNWAPRR